MVSFIISLVSVVVHLAAMFMALRLIKVTENSSAWVIISASISLMTLRRLENLYNFVYSAAKMNPVSYEVIGLAISVLLLVGMFKIAPVFLSIKSSRDEVRKSLSEKEIVLRELDQTKQLLEVVANGITDEIMLISKDFKVLWVNDAVMRCHKGDHNELIGVHCYRLTHHVDVPCQPPDDVCPIMEHEAGRHTVVQHTHTADDGSVAIVEISVYPIRGSNGDVDRFIHVSKDITARVRQEEEIRNLNKLLEQKVREEVSLREEERKLLFQQSKMAAMGEMIGAIAHQWRQPLNAISLISQEIHDAYRYNEMTEEYMKETIGTILKQIDFMSKTINDFRNLLNPSKTATAFFIDEAIEDILFMFSDMLSKSNIVVTFEKDDLTDNCVAVGQPNEFKHVVLNLINNSKDAICSQWDNHILSEDMKGMINIRLSRVDGKALVTISDNGGGIPDEIIDKIFSPHFTTKPDDKGTGIGLYISKTIIDGMGSRLSVRNANGGAEFTISLDAK
ncbi:MAG: ATP-binding protein [Candidatus Magnetominusculus sp. LBB02]|nr:ATP-binding protein [Candidatus Magnetominusculus sp. LBB02]